MCFRLRKFLRENDIDFGRQPLSQWEINENFVVDEVESVFPNHLLVVNMTAPPEVIVDITAVDREIFEDALTAEGNRIVKIETKNNYCFVEESNLRDIGIALRDRPANEGLVLILQDGTETMAGEKVKYFSLCDDIYQLPQREKRKHWDQDTESGDEPSPKKNKQPNHRREILMETLESAATVLRDFIETTVPGVDSVANEVELLRAFERFFQQTSPQ